MPDRPWTGRPAFPFAVLAAAAGLLLAAGRLEALAPAGALPPPALLATLVALGAAATFLRPPGAEAPTLGLGAAILPPAVALLGPVPAAWLAALTLVVSRLLRRLLTGGALRRVGTSRPLRWLGSGPDWRRRAGGWRELALAVGWVTLATLLAGSVVALGGGPTGPALWWLLPLWPLLVLAGRSLAGERRHAESLAPAGLEAAGIGLGLLLAPVTVALGWGGALPLLAAFALLALLAGHERRRADRFKARIGHLAHAGHRVGAPERGDIGSLVQRLAEECRLVVPCEWLELVLEGDPEVERSWHVGPDGELGEGRPAPPATPPPLPGIHRRGTWRTYELALRVEDQLVGRLRLWCDPRRLRRDDVELVRQLQPQIALSVHQTLLARQARQDPLTGIATRRVLESSLQQAYWRARELGRPVTVLMCDLDHFKRINDVHGHAIGDRALVAVARILCLHLRDGDLCSRYGGEEFTLLLDGLGGEKGLEVAERLRERVAATPLAADDESVAMTVSVGVASSDEVALHRPEDLLELADRALYEAKRQGRNRCLLYLGEGRYLDPAGQLLVASDARAQPKRPRIFT